MRVFISLDLTLILFSTLPLLMLTLNLDLLIFPGTFLMILLTRTWFLGQGNLVLRCIGPYRISKRVGNVAYEFELPQALAAVHPVFHISMLKKFLGDPSLIIPTENVGIKDNLSYEEVLVQIFGSSGAHEDKGSCLGQGPLEEPIC